MQEYIPPSVPPSGALRGRPPGARRKLAGRQNRAATTLADDLAADLYRVVHNCLFAGANCSEIRVCLAESCHQLLVHPGRSTS